MIKSIIKTYKDCTKEKLVLNYSVGKVGSSSINKSLEQLGIQTIHCHSLFRSIVYDMFYKYKSTKTFINKFKKRSFIDNLKIKVKSAIRLYALRRRKKPLKIISAVREPIARTISRYFQDIQIPLSDLFIKAPSKIYLETIINDFINNANHNQSLNWFDKELKRAFNIDVYKYPFNKEKGYTIIREGNIELLIIKLESQNRLEKVISDFIGEPNFSLFNDNEGGKKWYSSLYNEFNKAIEFEEDFIENLYKSKYMNHFYSTREIFEFKNKYLKNKKQGV